ncbi:cornifelin homolog A isoform X1 [Periophthalmus magnuspinnatus]|uniref:cornifelin homolog A isoform X1 n=1 Tax=Periophthalmus magnuspinnatus TaxID=409849 RepID=UPI002436E977|nr:cornifelin homolog A isoform X1 [Periophthalmus magnuspinnatus]
MEQTVTQQPRLSLSKRPSSDFQYQKMAEFIPENEDSWRSEVIPAVSDLVLTQPGLGVTTTTVTTITQTGGDWSTGLFDICSERNIGILGALVPCCLDLSLAHQFGESFCLPLLPGSTFALRVGIRERYKIQGNVCDDWLTVCCCYPLALCQMKREMTKRMKTKSYHVITALDCS